MKDLGLITIEPPTGGGMRCGHGTRYLFADGSEFKEVTRCVVTFAPDEVLTATFDVAIDPKSNIEAHPMLSFEAVKVAAAHYGCAVVKRGAFPPRLFQALTWTNLALIACLVFVALPSTKEIGRRDGAHEQIQLCQRIASAREVSEEKLHQLRICIALAEHLVDSIENRERP